MCTMQMFVYVQNKLSEIPDAIVEEKNTNINSVLSHMLAIVKHDYSIFSNSHLLPNLYC